MSAAWHHDLALLWAQSWAMLDPGAPQDRLSGRLVTLATVGQAGPELRQLVLRAARPDVAQIDLHTDAATAKLRQIAACPDVAVLAWDRARALQLRLNGTAQIITGPLARAAWQDVPHAARPNYGVTPAPGTPISGPSAYARDPGNEDRFAIIRIALSRIDAVVLCEPEHRRAGYAALSNWAGTWLAP